MLYYTPSTKRIKIRTTQTNPCPLQHNQLKQIDLPTVSTTLHSIIHTK